MKAKLTLLPALIVTMIGLSLAQPVIENVDHSPKNIDVGDTVEVEAKAQGTDINFIQFRVSGESWNTEDCNTFGSCNRTWDFEVDEEGITNVEIKAANDDYEYSEVKDYYITVNEDRETSMTISGVPSEAEVGESYTVNAEAYDSKGRLGNQDLDIYYRYNDGERQSERIGGSECYYRRSIGEGRTECGASASFEPVEGASDHRIFASITASDGLIIWKPEEFYVAEPETESDLVINEVSISDEEIEEDTEATVEAEVENEGSESGYATLRWYADDTRIATANRNIEPGEIKTLSRDISYSDLEDEGLVTGEEYDLSAEENLDGDTEESQDTVMLLEPEDSSSDFIVDITDTNDPVEEGEDLEVEYEVNNEGGQKDTQDIELYVDGNLEDSEPDTLRVGATSTGTLIWETEEGDAGWETVEVQTEDDSDTRNVNIERGDRDPESDVELETVSASKYTIGVGESTEIRANVRNNRDSSSFVQVNWEADNTNIAGSTVNIPSNSERTLDRDRTYNELINQGLEAGECYDLSGRLQFDGDIDSSEEAPNDLCLEQEISEDPAFFDVRDISFDSPVYVDDRVEVDYTVKNTGDSSARKTVRLKLDGETKDTESVRLDGGEEKDGTLDFRPEEDEVGVKDLSISTNDDERSGPINIRERTQDPAFFDVEIDGYDNEVTEGETVEVDYTVTNTGDQDDIQNIELRARGETQDTNFNVGLDEGESESGTLEWDTEEGDSGWRTIKVRSEDDDETEVVRIKDGDEPIEDADVEFSSVSASRYTVRPGELTELRSSVENEGGISASVQVEWRAGGTSIGSDSRTVPGDSERDLERDRSYSQLLSEGLEAGECYNLGARLRSGGNLVDYRDAPQNLCLEEDDEPEDPEGEYDLKTIVLSSSGSPIEGAEVSAGSRTALTRSDGVATIEDLDEGSYDVIASKPGYSTEVRDNVDVDRDRTISLTLDEVEGVEADFSFSPSRPLEDQEVVFNGGLSSGDIESYEWDFDDGSTARGRTVEHEFDDSGFYMVGLEVEDLRGRTDERTRVVQVRSEEADPEFYDLDIEVVDSETDDEIEDARVSVDGRTRTTDDDGEASFNLEESVYSVFVSADDYRSESRTVTLNRDRDIEVELDPRDREFGRGEIRIQDLRIPASVCRGDDVTARLDIENTGDRDRVFTLSASGLSNEIDRTYSLDEGDEFTRSVEFINVEGSGNERVSFTTGDDSRERIVQLRDCEDEESSDISITASPTQIRAGESVRVSGYVDNVERGTQVTIGSSNRYRSLGSATTDPSGRYELYVEPTEIGDQTLTAEASGMEANTRIEVLPTVSVISASTRPERVFEGDTYEVCAQLESQSSGPLVVLKEDGQEVDSKYGRGEVCFDRRKAPGNYNYEIVGYARGQSSTKTASVEVMEMDSEVRNFPDQIASVRSGSGMVRVQLYNNQREFRNYEISLEGLPDSWTSQSRKQVHLDSGEGRTEYLYFTPKDEGDFTGTLRVESEGRTVYTEDIDISSGGTDRGPSRIDQFLMWLRYR